MLFYITAVFPSHYISASRIERRANLQKQLVQEVVTQSLNEENEKKMKQLEGKQKTSKADNGVLSVKVEESMVQDAPKVKPSLATSQPLKIKIPKQHGGPQHSQLQAHLLAPNPIKKFGNGNSQYEEVGGRSLLQQDAPVAAASAGQGSNVEDDDGSGNGGILPGAARQPCSAHCPGKRNQMPNLMCSRCFCLFHIGCVPDGIWLQNPNRFLCPVSVEKWLYHSLVFLFIILCFFCRTASLLKINFWPNQQITQSSSPPLIRALLVLITFRP